MFTYNPEKSWRATNTCKMPLLALGAAGDPGHLDFTVDLRVAISVQKKMPGEVSHIILCPSNILFDHFRF